VPENAGKNGLWVKCGDNASGNSKGNSNGSSSDEPPLIEGGIPEMSLQAF
jgi:hypothetical protein